MQFLRLCIAKDLNVVPRALYSYEAPPGNPSGSPAVSSGRAILDAELVNSATFQQILDYIYTSVISLGEDNIQDTLQVPHWHTLLLCV